MERLPVSSHHLPDPELVDYADLAARHAAAASEGDARGQARRDQTALLQLQQARRELCWLRDVLDPSATAPTGPGHGCRPRDRSLWRRVRPRRVTRPG
jgi:hypothetical protein